jgi:hypothetical protein
MPSLDDGAAGHRNGHLRSPASSPAAIRLRRVVNWLTLGTPFGLALARYAGCEIGPGPYGILVAKGFDRGPVKGRAMTFGDVVLLGIDEEQLAGRPHLFEHEARHCGQYAYCGGLIPFSIAYGLASLYSWLLTRNPALRNVFEVRAGLVEGGYRPE